VKLSKREITSLKPLLGLITGRDIRRIYKRDKSLPLDIDNEISVLYRLYKRIHKINEQNKKLKQLQSILERNRE
jgi:hypothetical protein